MKHAERLLLLAIVLAAGGGLGYKLLSDFELAGMILFAICCLVLAEVFYRIDKKISHKK